MCPFNCRIIYTSSYMNDQQTCVADKKVINFCFMNLPQLYKININVFIVRCDAD